MKFINTTDKEARDMIARNKSDGAYEVTFWNKAGDADVRPD